MQTLTSVSTKLLNSHFPKSTYKNLNITIILKVSEQPKTARSKIRRDVKQDYVVARMHMKDFTHFKTDFRDNHTREIE